MPVTYDELPELHYIAPVENLPSIFEHGILSHRRAEEVAHRSIALPEVQDRRARVTVPGGRPLHEYVNLYFHARNPMMYSRQAEHEALTVLSVRKEVIRHSGVVVTDRNASSDYVRFADGVKGLAIVDHEHVYAEDWTHQDLREQWRRKSMKCAEVLVPDRIDTAFVRGGYVSCRAGKEAVHAVRPALRIKISPDLFFQ